MTRGIGMSNAEAMLRTRLIEAEDRVRELTLRDEVAITHIETLTNERDMWKANYFALAFPNG